MEGARARIVRTTRTLRTVPSVTVAIALAVSAIVAVSVDAFASWRALVTLPFALWAPGHVLVAAVAPDTSRRLSGLEDAAASVTLSLALLPVLGLATFLTLGVNALAVTGVLAVTTLALAAVALARRPGVPHARPALPSARPVVAWSVAGGALAFAGVIALVPFTAEDAPAHLALTGADGALDALPRVLAANATLTVRVEAGAGDAPRDGRLVVTLEHVENATTRELVDASLTVPAGDSRSRDVRVGPLPVGTHRLVASWDVDEGRTVHAWFTVKEGAP